MSIDYTGFALPKDSREDAERKRRQRKADIRTHEQREKATVVTRDGSHYCRLVPGCSERQKFETAHLDDKGMGGDPKQLRTVACLMLRACFFHHQGNWSLHSHDLRVDFLTPEGADGPIEVWGRDSTGRWFMVGRESAVGSWERD